MKLLTCVLYTRKYGMHYRGPGFLAVVMYDLAPSTTPPFPSVSSTVDTQED
jgi:hypothetical protein